MHHVSKETVWLNDQATTERWTREHLDAIDKQVETLWLQIAWYRHSTFWGRLRWLLRGYQ